MLNMARITREKKGRKKSFFAIANQLCQINKFDVGDSLDPVGALAKVKAKNDKKKIFISQIFSLLTTFSPAWPDHN